MKKLTTLKLPLPKTRNSYIGRHWGYYQNLKHKYEDIAYYETQAAAKGVGEVEKFHLHFTFVLPDSRRRDLDNLFASYEVKGVIDGVSKALKCDDNIFKFSFSVDAEVEKGRGLLIVEVFIKAKGGGEGARF